MADGIAAIQQRVAQIQQQVAAVTRTAAPPVSATPVARSDSFATALTSARGATSTGALTPAIQKAPGSYGTMNVPDELRKYGNGKVPAEALASIGIGDFRLERNAAAAFTKMRADAAAAGVTIGVEDAYRSYDEQVDIANRKGLYKNGGLAAVPGTSNHGWGLAADLDLDDNALAWMRENGHKYGFVEDTPREPWHWGYRPAV